jgi:hypothetical protein
VKKLSFSFQFHSDNKWKNNKSCINIDYKHYHKLWKWYIVHTPTVTNIGTVWTLRLYPTKFDANRICTKVANNFLPKIIIIWRTTICKIIIHPCKQQTILVRVGFDRISTYTRTQHLTYGLHRMLLPDYHLILPKYNIKNTRFIGLQICEIGMQTL